MARDDTGTEYSLEEYRRLVSSRWQRGSGGGGAAFSPLSLGPLAYWPLDEGSGATAADASGNGYDLDLINTPTWIAGGGLDFAAASSEKAETSAAGLIAALEGAEAWTVALWARAAAYQENAAAVGIHNAGSGTASFIFYPYDNFEGNGPRFYLHTGVANGGVEGTDTEVSLNEFHFFAAVQRSLTDRELFQNNVSMGTMGFSSALPATLSHVTIGAWNGGQYFDGGIRRPILFDRALTADELTALYLHGSA